MIFEALALAGAYLLRPEPHEDARGSFTRLFDRAAFLERGLVVDWTQASTSYNRHAGTLRGLHFQLAPAGETKLIRCTAGAVYDVLVDVRAGSATFGRHVACELSASGREQLYVPAGLAHGFQALVDGAELAYWIDAPYAPELARGLAHDDPGLAIAWPLPVAVIGERDRAWPRLEALRC